MLDSITCLLCVTIRKRDNKWTMICIFCHLHMLELLILALSVCGLRLCDDMTYMHNHDVMCMDKMFSHLGFLFFSFSPEMLTHSLIFSPKLVVRDIQIGYLSCSIFQMIIHTWSDNYTYTLAQEIFKACFNYLDSLFSLKDAIKQFAKYL